MHLCTSRKWFHSLNEILPNIHCNRSNHRQQESRAQAMTTTAITKTQQEKPLVRLYTTQSLHSKI